MTDQILEKRWENNGAVRQLFTDFKPTIQLGGKHYTIFSTSLEYILKTI
jgi:hypothetical protein